MSTRIKIALVVAAVAANVAVFWWRLTYSPEPLPLRSRRPLDLGEKQAALVLEWKKADKIPLTTDGIAGYVDQLQWQRCIKPPVGAKVVPVKTLTDDQKAGLKQAANGLITAYVAGTAEALLEYMADRGQQISPSMVTELKKLLATDGGFSESSLALLDDRGVFLTFADEASYMPHWSALVEGTACTILWRMPHGSGQTIPENLGADVAGLFKNQTRFHHLFINTDAKSPAFDPNAYELYADFRFVIEHDEEFLGEPSPYYVRFGYNAKLSIWQPLELVHVATISGNSPILLF